ncbi:MAG: hypothetical protein HGA54_07230, partial [Actinobacteria bacterium]|nr:hypothetical protein [Actinomycetota bacterium]
IEQDTSAIKFTCEKIIRRLSEKNPELLYPYFERIARLMDSENSFIKWGFIQIMPNMLKVDSENKWEAIEERYLPFLDATSVVTFGSAVAGIRSIIDSHPESEHAIIPKLLEIDKHTFLHKGEVSPECTNVAKGQLIDSFDSLYPYSHYKDQMLAFVQTNVDNPRQQVRVKAKRFLKKYNA